MGARDPLRVLIAGGGVAGLEAALALRALAGDRGIEGRQFEPGAGLSKQVEAALAEVANLVLAEIASLTSPA